MRRLLVPLIAVGVTIVTMGCSGSDESSTASSTTSSSTTSSVVVSAANQPTCTAIDALSEATKADVVGDSPDPVANATNIQVFIVSLIPLLEAIEAVAPADLAPSVDVLLANGKSAEALDPTDAEDQTTLGRMIIVPNAEATAANETLESWANENCGATIAR